MSGIFLAYEFSIAFNYSESCMLGVDADNRHDWVFSWIFCAVLWTSLPFFHDSLNFKLIASLMPSTIATISGIAITFAISMICRYAFQ